MVGSVKYPIRTKMAALCAFLTIFATGAYLALAVSVFRADKLELVYELNHSTVRSLTGELDSFIRSAREQIRILAQVSSNREIVEGLLAGDKDVLHFALFERAKEWKPLVEFSGRDQKQMSMDRASIPWARIEKEGLVTWNSSRVPEDMPAISVAVRILAENDRGAELIGVLEYKADLILRAMGARSLAEVFAVESSGRVYLHPSSDHLYVSKLLQEDPLIKEALQSPLRTQVRNYRDGNKEWLAAFSTTELGGVRVLSRVDSSQALRAARGLIARSVVFFGIIVTLSIILSTWLARQFTRPLSSLVEATERISKGDLNVTLHVDTRDELAVLTSSFNVMAFELARQRAALEQQQHELTLKVKERTQSLETEKRSTAEAQQNLLKTTRLATLGEMAGVTAHEVLNPLNNMNIRIEKFKAQTAALRESDLQVLGQILSGWRAAVAAGGVSQLASELAKSVSPEKRLIDEDLDNLDGIAKDFQGTLSSFREDMVFFSSQIARVTRIVNNMRSLSRVGGERRPIDVHRPLDDTLLTLKDAAQKRKVSLVSEYSQDPRENFVIIADHDELIQVFSNLVRNAMDALMQTRELRAPEVRIRTSWDEGRVIVQICDNGPGVDAAIRARLFEPNVTTKSAADGTGLGLSICRRIIRAFDGDIDVVDREDGQPGAVFRVWLPRVRS